MFAGPPVRHAETGAHLVPASLEVELQRLDVVTDRFGDPERPLRLSVLVLAVGRGLGSLLDFAAPAGGLVPRLRCKLEIKLKYVE